MKTIALAPWTEACGTLLNVVEEETSITLIFGKFQVKLGLNESKAIKSLLNDEIIGKEISILRTDLVNEPILLRKL